MNPWSFFFIGYVFSQPHFHKFFTSILGKSVDNRVGEW